MSMSRRRALGVPGAIGAGWHGDDSRLVSVDGGPFGHLDPASAAGTALREPLGTRS